MQSYSFFQKAWAQFSYHKQCVYKTRLDYPRQPTTTTNMRTRRRRNGFKNTQPLCVARITEEIKLDLRSPQGGCHLRNWRTIADVKDPALSVQLLASRGQVPHDLCLLYDRRQNHDRPPPPPSPLSLDTCILVLSSKRQVLVGWLLNVPVTCQSISETDLL